ncbi:DHA2 family multidrug resistance protein [Caulobacter ginsengisoli]|uniref:DHA2 family multidrug resistance protein n=1 Tax=Caulobacter ginsengisoli TaxID=400775 RepID=A0ABU0IV89_9CAUL|nr:DHA2 family multidrug resistance protein [Caulobacter ginsengisoli]
MTDAAATAGPIPQTPPSGPAPQKAMDGSTVNWGMLFLGFGGMVIGQFMAILDIQIVSASLPQIQAGVGASADQVSWIQTAYLIPEVVMIPLSSYLSRLWGTQRVFLASCFGFIAMSVLAGLSTSIDFMIVTRALQGFVGGAMVPTVFATAFSAFPPERRTTANVITGMIVTLAPTIGPALGGHVTEWLDWRWLFFINVGPGALSLFLVWRYGNFDKGDRSLATNFDWFGLSVMAVFLMSLQYVLEEGAKDNWFHEDKILWLAVLALITGTVFIWRNLTYFKPIVQLRAFQDRNFALGVCMTAVSGASLYGGTFILPLFLGRIRGYSAAEVGTTMLVSGLCMFFTGPTIGSIVRKVDPRLPMIVGFGMVAWGMWLGHAVTADWGFWQFAGLQAWRGVGVMVAMIATTQMTMSTLTPQMIKDASGMVNLSRNVGGAMAMALISTTLATQTAVHMNELSAAMSTASGEAVAMMNGLTMRMQQLGVTDPQGAAYKAMHYILYQKAQLLAFGDAFALLSLGAVAAAFLSIFTAPAKMAPGGPDMSEAH